MIEEIKKEIENITHIFDGKAVVRQHDIFKILDKYKCRSNVADVSQLEKYKGVVEEIRIIINHRLLDKVDFKSICDRNGIEVKK